MKKIKNFVFLFLISNATFSLTAQEFNVPQNISLKSDQDYKNYENDVVGAVNWLEEIPVIEQTDKRKKVNSFLLQWITGSPDITIELAQFQTKLTEDNPDLLLIFMGGWSKFAIENPSESKNAFLGNLAGIKSVIKVYSANVGKGVKKNKKIEKMLELSEADLQAYVQKEMN